MKMMLKNHAFVNANVAILLRINWALLLFANNYDHIYLG